MNPRDAWIHMQKTRKWMRTLNNVISPMDDAVECFEDDFSDLTEKLNKPEFLSKFKGCQFAEIE